MTTPTDPTTLRTALEALVRLVEPRWGMFPGDWACVECVPTSDILRDGFLCGYHAARAALATPAPAADEARCGFPDCGGRRGNILHNPGVGDTLDDHPFQPTLTPAPPTPPASEPVAALGPSTKAGWALLSKEALNSRSFTLINAADIIAIEQEAAARTDATEPVAALVDVLMADFRDVMWNGTLRERVAAIVAAARAEVTEPVAATMEKPGYALFREMRERSGMTLRAAAPRLGIDFTYLSKVENGHERPSDALVRKMGRLYGFDAESVLVGRAAAEVPEPVRRAIVAAASAEVDVERLLEASNVLPDDHPIVGGAWTWYSRGWDDRGDAIRAHSAAAYRDSGPRRTA